MTREEAIKELSCIADEMPSMECANWIEAISMAIEELSQEPCKDAISRQEVLDALDKSKYSNEFCEEHHIDWSINLGMAHIIVNELKSVIPVEKQELKIKILERDEVARKLGVIDIYEALEWIILLNHLEYLGLKICEVEE